MKRSSALLWAVLLSAQAAAPETQVVPASPPPAPSAIKPAGPPARTHMAAAAQRNENVAVQQIDTNAAKEGEYPPRNARDGVAVHRSGFDILRGGARATGNGGTSTRDCFQASWMARRSVLEPPEQRGQRSHILPGRACAAFEAEPLRFRGTADAGPLGFVTFSGTQRQIRAGMVNGNVLVPLESERRR
jgi:hypothetical protein